MGELGGKGDVRQLPDRINEIDFLLQREMVRAERFLFCDRITFSTKNHSDGENCFFPSVNAYMKLIEYLTSKS